ncbi:MAG TPA: 3-isopropylmalate dehydratase large subunit [Bacteroidales bacterium]|jgi:3-isopropylmalate/(R)-2-methylmalate dehydratase large subunit|nr:MAG: 3-isopropylmalate dehydratase large subunit [Bacteroidetes bacterium ADurb.Bin145]HOU03484.1 3-isopropylmalate dehydratase large subunit [Bacteroidales bacterium]HQK69120.1 3-isopropylmalate dehydratase large subunit [Bacteroidales bacterium]
MEPKTLFDKIWDSHVVQSIKGGPDVLYIDRHFIHEVTSPQAFDGLRKRGLQVFRPAKTIATADHNIPTRDQDKPIKDELSRNQVGTLEKNCRDFNIEYFGLNHPKNGIVHVVGPELGYTLPGMTIVCGDSHTSTHGAFGTVAFGIGTSEVEMVLASQCIIQPKPKKMRITVNGSLQKGVTSKDIILYIISRLSAGGATGYFVEYSGTAIESLSMEGRMTVCNMSIEMGARGGLIAPDMKTFEYLSKVLPADLKPDFNSLVKGWMKLKTDKEAVFDLEKEFDAGDIKPMITYGTNPGLGMAVDDTIPEKAGNKEENAAFLRSLDYMGFKPGEKLLGHPVDYVFVGSCTNGRIEDLRAFAELVRGRKKDPGITALIVPGSKKVEQQAISEGIADTLKKAGFELRQPGCSSCLAMNEDKIPAGKYAVSTSNRNFEGRQGPGARTLLASPLTAAAAAVTGKITDPRDLLNN